MKQLINIYNDIINKHDLNKYKLTLAEFREIEDIIQDLILKRYSTTISQRIHDLIKTNTDLYIIKCGIGWLIERKSRTA